MTDQNNQPNNSGSGRNVKDAVNTLVSVALRSLSSPTLFNILRAHPLLGNILVGFLTSGTIVSGLLLLGIGDPAQVNAASMCEKIRVSEIRTRLNIDSTQIEVTNAGSSTENPDIDNGLFSCEYTITDDSEGDNPRDEKFHIVYLVVEDKLTSSIDEKKLEKDVLRKEFCENEEYYIEKLESQGYNAETQSIKAEGLELLDDPTNSFYPVFRWKCMYSIFPKEPKELTEPSAQPPRIPVGLDIDPYCKKTYLEEGLTVARYRYFNDPDSLYCVNANF